MTLHHQQAVTPSKRWMAVGAQALIPGLGYLLLGGKRRGLVMGALVWFSFLLGMTHDGSLSLRNPEQPILSTLQLVGNVGVPPLDFVGRIVVYGKPAYQLPHETHQVAQVYRARLRMPTSTYGTAYLWIAGLMNYLMMFDVWDYKRWARSVTEET